MANTNQIRVELIGKDKSLGKSFKSAGKDALTFGSKLKLIGNAFKKMLRGDFQGMKTALGAAGVGFASFATIATAGIAAVAAAIGGLIILVLKAKKTYETWMQTLDDFQDVTGLGAEAVSLLAAQARLADVDVNKLSNGVFIFTKNLDAARQGSAAQAAAFDRLGVAIVNADGSVRPLNDVLIEARDRLSEIDDQTTRNALAAKLFGKGAKDMADWLAKSSTQMRAYAKFARDLGMVMGEESMKNFQQYRENQRKIAFAWDAIKINAYAALVPLINQLMPKIISLISKGAAWLTRFRVLVEKKGWETAIRQMVPWLTRVIEKARTANAWWNANRASIYSAASAVGSFMAKVIQVVNWVDSHWSSLSSAIQASINPLSRLASLAASLWGTLSRIMSFRMPSLSSGNFSGGGGGGGGKASGGARAVGGPVTRGMQYLVGERGPELFTAPVSGSIVPNNRLAMAGPSQTLNVNVTLAMPGGSTIVGTASEVCRILAPGIAREIERQAARMNRRR